MITDASHYAAFAAAYARGALGAPTLDDATAVTRGTEAGLKLHRFKRTAQLPRVRAVIGALRGFAATRLVDLGSGRGAFVWPLLDALPAIDLVATDVLDHRALLFEHVRRGGLARVAGVRADITALPFADASAECVTALEVLEHLPGDGPAAAAREALRVARVAVIASVPSHEDDNPEHVHLFDGAGLATLFRAAGARRVTTEHVLNHIVVVALR
ncbi:MAG: class I SAM-dependent methyltransferase [Kofleriaceae bacterium]